MSTDTDTAPKKASKNQKTKVVEPPVGKLSNASHPEAIHIQGARVNNLKNVSCDLPLERLTVITGLSGSGKSSLAFDTLYAEGQRRFIESMSSYARQFLARIEKPDVDKIDHILPAIALEQKNSVKNARMTVGTSTEIDDFLRVLMASVGKTHCSACGHQEVSRENPLQIEKKVLAFADGAKLLLLSPIRLHEVSLGDIQAKGFVRVFYHNEMLELTPETKARLQQEVNEHETLYVVIDRLIVRQDKQKSLGARLLESIKNALELGHGKIEIRNLDTQDIHLYQTEYACMNCHTPYPEPFPNLFSFNSPLGACSTCEGFGRIIGLDLDKVIPNKQLSLKDHAVHPFSTPANEQMYDDLMVECKKRKIPVDVPYATLNNEQKAFVVDGGGRYDGIRPFFEWLEGKKYKVHVRVMLAKYRGYYPCPECLGSRLQKNALNVFLHAEGSNVKNMLDLGQMTIRDLQQFFADLELTEHERLLSERLVKEIQNRLDYLNRIGLSYLTLSRQARTLSGGESQRIHLSSALGSRLTDTLYVLDEPTVGLHARDTDRLLGILRTLRDHGNTVVVVEHDPDVMLACDHIVDMGPGGGEEGGRIIYEGTPEGLLESKVSQTGQFLKHPKLVISKSSEKSKNGMQPELASGEAVTIIGARGNNLKNVTVALPNNKLVCITGVSGSGKSTLIKQTLYTAYEHSQGQSLQLDLAPHDGIEGLDHFSEILLVDQSPPGRSSRSNPMTYVKAYDDIRTLMAATRKAKILGITPSDFSFNSVGGRCEACEGLGTVTIDMQFMADVTMTCPDCNGRRFTPNVLSIELEHPTEDPKNIDGILNMTVDEAIPYFAAYPKVQRKLRPLQEIGLGYLRLGQSTTTLSGGEAQRLKLASYLKDVESSSSKKNQKPVLFLFDEPTTGLHMADIYRLVEAFRRILEVGHSVVVIEHNIDFIAQSDYIIDLGPEGGDGGGEIVVKGSIEDVMACKASITGEFLKQRLSALKA